MSGLGFIEASDGVQDPNTRTPKTQIHAHPLEILIQIQDHLENPLFPRTLWPIPIMPSDPILKQHIFQGRASTNIVYD